MIDIAKFNFVNGLSYKESKQMICLVLRCVSTYVGTINQLVLHMYILCKNYIEMIEIVKFSFVNGFSYRESKQTVCLVRGCVSTYMGTINRDPLSVCRIIPHVTGDAHH
jgi:dethiobiotin synthetase